MRHFIHILLTAAVFTAGNCHLPVLQAVAWAGMLVSYQQGRSWAQAAEMTFDGEHPCPMCKAIRKQLEMERGELKPFNVDFRFTTFLEPTLAWIHTLRWICGFVDARPVGLRLSHPPERRPPR